MTRLHREFHRLFRCSPIVPADGALRRTDPAAAEGPVRTLVLELARPAWWPPLAAVWKGVQTDYGLPAPAIAVNGRDGLQLWFSLAQAQDPARGLAFLEGLRLRYLADLPRDRVGLMPWSGSTAGSGAAPLATVVPAAQAASGGWSAFVAPDLAPMFEEEPWLALHPGDDGQAELLARLDSTPLALFDAALEGLQAHAADARATVAASTAAAVAAAAARAASADVGTADLPAAVNREAQRFLLAVMNDAAAPLALRVEAAKALLPWGPQA